MARRTPLPHKNGKRDLRAFLLLWAAIFGLFTFAGCGPTYPEMRIKESIVRICKKEYGLDVKAMTIGKTIAVYLPLSDLIDFTFAITKSASDKIQDVILSISRVALSTDADFDFYCIIAHDVRIPEIQIVIIKSVDDVKRLLLSDISRGEYSKRMLIDMRLSPQSQKERAIKEVFEKMKVDPNWQEQVMSDFFRSEPTVLGDIGYWNGRFYIKDISLAEFLAEQMASRIKIEFKENKELSEKFFIKTAKGLYVKSDKGHSFEIEVLADFNRLNEAEDEGMSDKLFHGIMRVAYQVTHGYKFEDFDYVEAFNQSDGRRMKVSKENLENFKSKKNKIEDVMDVGV